MIHCLFGRAAVIRIALSSAFVCVFAVTFGCGGTQPPITVKGKVTIKGSGDLVAGNIVFVGTDGKEIKGPLTKGEYKVEPPTPGNYKIYILGMPGSGAADKTTAVIPGADKGGMKLETASMGVPPPDKYTKADTSGLTLEVTKDKMQEGKNFELEAK